MAAPRCSFTAAFVLLCAVAGVGGAASNDTCAYAEWALEDALLEDGLCAHVFASGLDKPRGIWPVHGSGCVLVLERGRGRIVALHDDDGDGRADATSVIATQPGVNHGLAVHGGYVYASSDTTVWRWPYRAGQRTTSPDSVKEVVVRDMNADGRGGAPGGHTTRTLAFDANGVLYVSVGSYSNVDADSHRSRIRRFTLTTNTDNAVPVGGFDFQNDGELFADGLRNEVGLAFDKRGVLWGVENGADNLHRADLGGDIHDEHPAEELNAFREDDVGKHWGYPYCWTQFGTDLAGPGVGAAKGTVWAWPSFVNDGVHTDAWCRANTVPPRVAMQAHSAPLGLAFYSHESALTRCPSGQNNKTALPANMDGDAFVGYHGSWNRSPPTGHKVVRVPMTSAGAVEGGDVADVTPIDVMKNGKGEGARWANGLRPVDVRFDACGRLLVSDDGPGGYVLMITGAGGNSTDGGRARVGGKGATDPTPGLATSGAPRRLGFRAIAFVVALALVSLVITFEGFRRDET